MKGSAQDSEIHPLYPSGDWEGFYIYAQGPGARQHPMQLILNFKNHKISGAGFDDVGAFSWSGEYNLKSHVVFLTKSYATHQVQYSGFADEHGIWGNWVLSGLKGGFHIWPRKSASNNAVKEVEEISNISIK